MQPITARTDRRRTRPLAASDPDPDDFPDASSPNASASDARRLESDDLLAELPEDDLSDEDDRDDGDGGHDGDDVEGPERAVPGRSVLLPSCAAALLAVVGALCLLPVPLPWEAPTPAATSTTATERQATTPPTGNVEGGSASSPAPPALTTTAGAPHPVLPPAASTTDSVAPSPPTPAAGEDASSIPTPEDTLAGPVSDQVLQDLLNSSLPRDRAITDPALLGSTDGQELLEVAWQALASDVEAGGWTQPHQQAHAVLRTGRDDTQDLPIVVDVVVMWAALDGQGERTERELSTVRVSKGSGSWAPGKITTASDGS
ncbi:hypothetical protein [Kineococcus radiotolerans]|uniref:Uncharacterized protein n=1 Tax=Kineococcus radiotolerans (strain ATCC BAA-149 / DSM 14245 / SRS30216) TaxID=266940 RepID=A6WGZ8_KINRD|nr:hypothetical protein [Kineococcus radiotolerans]ABS06087.1 hypothetical protein Krad_4628 [Kineococcus radiotolerans SRS30216 = ATCC BAA-149]